MEILIGQISRNLLKGLTALGIIGAFAFLLYPFLPALLMGAILALALSSLIQRIESKGYTRKQSLNILMAGVFLMFFTPTLIFIIRGASLVTSLIRDPQTTIKLKALQENVIAMVSQYIPGLSGSLSGQLDQGFSYASSMVLTVFSSLLSEIPNLILFSVIMTLSIYFFLYHENGIRILFDRYFGFKEDNGNKFINMIQTSSREVFLSNVLTGLLQASVVTLGAIVFQISEWFLIFFVTFIASFIPIIGAGPIAFLIGLFAFATGDNFAGVGMIVISVISGTSDNFIRPYLATLGETEVPAMISFLSVIGGVITLGLPGLFIGPLIASLAFGVLPLLTDEFFPERAVSQNKIKSSDQFENENSKPEIQI